MTESVTLLQHMSLVNTMVVIIISFIEVSTQCNHGDVRLVNGSAPNEGRVEVCVNSIWGTVCDVVGWGNEDAQVICRQLGYTTEEAIARSGGYYGQGEGPVWLNNVRCNLTWDMSLLECPHRPIPIITALSYCNHANDAGVQCRDDQGQVKTISATVINPVNTVMISWLLGNSTKAGVPTTFKIECYSEKHSIAISVSNQTSTISLGGLLPSTSYNCCVSVVYELYTARRICTEIETSSIKITEETTSGSIEEIPLTSIIGGVLGFIIAVLLVLSGMLFICLLRPQWKERLSTILPRFRRRMNVAGSTPVTRNKEEEEDVVMGTNEAYEAVAMCYPTTSCSYTSCMQGSVPEKHI